MSLIQKDGTKINVIKYGNSKIYEFLDKIPLFTTMKNHDPQLQGALSSSSDKNFHHGLF